MQITFSRSCDVMIGSNQKQLDSDTLILSYYELEANRDLKFHELDNKVLRVVSSSSSSVFTTKTVISYAQTRTICSTTTVLFVLLHTECDVCFLQSCLYNMPIA